MDMNQLAFVVASAEWHRAKTALVSWLYASTRDGVPETRWVGSWHPSSTICLCVCVCGGGGGGGGGGVSSEEHTC